MPQRAMLYIFLGIFFTSGFSGLIYESIWTHYLKLFLGHASYAQILVLAIFMGGMAAGSALASRFSGRWTNLILAYGICEGLIGVFGLVFHNLFITLTDAAFSQWFPSLGTPLAVHAVKWFLGALLILPQSILLGATFPLLAAGLVRRFPSDRGRWLATLYFVNSLGAAIGILFNAFMLIPAVGLPGAIMTAGILNILLAIAVYALSKHDRYPAELNATHTTSQSRQHSVLLVVAALTGLASFMYEIGWIRMLSMVLGSSTHSFEIMLSAFILGLALGGWIIRKRIDRIPNPVRTLLWIQISMAALAVLTLPLYQHIYSVMGFAFGAMAKTDGGYLLYTGTSLIVSMLVMLPATICAGTTLPLITCILLQRGQSDSAIGKVYAFNTLGSIVGIVCAVWWVMPLLGLKWVIGIGALTDVIAGLLLLFVLRSAVSFRVRVALACSVAAIVAIPVVSSLDAQLMASGVFRYGLSSASHGSILFHRDGKTSTVAVKKMAANRLSLLNNGKPDAAMHVGAQRDSSAPLEQGDEHTMVLLGTLPYLFNPDSQKIANIGLGSGLTTHTLLSHSGLKSLDNIEIEPSVLEAAQHFRPNVERVFTDSRNQIHFEDAKTFFAAHNLQYDAIVSEPSNPWVSGIAGLFSQEFYRDIQRYLTPKGVLIQWVQMYEISPPLIASIYRALRANFPEIHLYQLAHGDMAFVASRSPLAPQYAAPFAEANLSAELKKIGVHTAGDLAFRHLGQGNTLDLFFNTWKGMPNSDFFPLLDLGAAKTRFMSANAMSLLQIRHSLFLQQLTGNKPSFPKDLSRGTLNAQNDFLDARALYAQIMSEADMDAPARQKADLQASHFRTWLAQCAEKGGQDELIEQTLIEYGLIFWPYLEHDLLEPFFQRLQACMGPLTENAQNWILAHLAFFKGDHPRVLEMTQQYLNRATTLKSDGDRHMLLMYLSARLHTRHTERASYEALMAKLPREFLQDLELGALLSLLQQGLPPQFVQLQP